VAPAAVTAAVAWVEATAAAATAAGSGRSSRYTLPRQSSLNVSGLTIHSSYDATGTPAQTDNMDGLDKLSMAIHGSVPPFLTICIVYSLLSDKTFVGFKIVGEALNSRVKAVCSFGALVTNTALNIGICAFVLSKCDVWDDIASVSRMSAHRFESMEMCLPAQSASCILALMLLWIDRASGVAFAIAPANASFFVRSARSSAVAGAFIALSKNDPCAVVLLLLSYTGRPVGSWPSEQVRSFAHALRFAVRLYAMVFGLGMLWSVRDCAADAGCRATPTTAVLLVALSAAVP
jgi:hypothetical protein